MESNSNDLQVIEDFYKKVCSRAEEKMLMTHKLEGAHFNSMKEIIEEMRKEQS